MQNRTAGLSGHALQEAVFGGTLAFLGLVGAFRHSGIVPYLVVETVIRP